MKVLREFDAGDQHVYLVGGNRWSEGPKEIMDDAFGAQVLNLERHRVEQRKDRFTVVKREGSLARQVTKDLQWFDVGALEGGTIKRLASLIVDAKQAGSRCDDAWQESHSQLAHLFDEITGVRLSGTPSAAEKLSHLMIRRTCRALQFENVGLKPYAFYHESDRGYVRNRSGIGRIEASNVDKVLITLEEATAWFKRQHYRFVAESLYERLEREKSNPYGSGLVHYRVKGFVDEPKANQAELVFTYIHEVSHAWANTSDNVDEYGMYIRKWISNDTSRTANRAKKDPTLLLTSADFVAYAILRVAGSIQRNHLEREAWTD